MSSYKKQFNKKYGYKPEEAHSLEDISKITGYKLAGLKTIFMKGKTNYKTNPKARPFIKSPEQSGYSRVYASINQKSKGHNIDKIHLTKRT